MNAQLTPTTNSSCSRTAAEAQPNNQASGFQALFATASQNVSGSGTGPKVPSSTGKDSTSGGPERIGKKIAGKKCGEVAGGVVSGLAAALLVPAPAAIPDQNLDAGGGETDVEGCSGVGDPIQSAGEGASENLPVKQESSPAVKTTMAVVEKPSADPLGAMPPAGIFGARLEEASDKAKRLDASEIPVTVRAAEPKTTDAMPGSAPRAVAPHERRTPSDAVTAAVSGPVVQGDGNGTAASVRSVASVTTQPTAVSRQNAAALAASSQESSALKPTGGQRAGGRKSAAPGEVLTGSAERKATESGQAQAGFVVDSAAQKPDGPGRARWSYQPEAGVTGDDSFPAAAQNAASAAAAEPVTTPAPGGTAPHSAAASPAPLEHTATATASSAEANPAPAPPPLQAAQILQRMDKSEIRIGLQSTDFGAIRLHTTVANDQVGAAVSTSHAALRDALLVEAPSLERAMARHSLRLDSVDIGPGSSGTGSNSNSFENNERKSPVAAPPNGTAWATARARQSQSAGAVAASRDGSYRLDVQA